MKKLRYIAMLGLLLLPLLAVAQEDEKENQLTIGLQLMTRGEMRRGGLYRPEEVMAMEEEVRGADRSNFVLGRSRLIVGYERAWLETRLNVQHQGVWGQAGRGNVNVFEGWVRLKAPNGLFTQIGRQCLSYDDERIIGANDWSMTGSSHDVLKVGYEGHGHKAHAIFAYNQNAENTFGGTYYAGGAHPYKTMQVGWYHYDVPKVPLGASLIGMNIGMQGGEKGQDERTEWQQVVGGYVKYSPKCWGLEGSYYKQMGHNEDGLAIDAWMASVLGELHLKPTYGFVAGYDYLSGDKYFAVPPHGSIGLVPHDVIRGFNPIYGSHHQFYGAMDFFYMSTYVNGFTPGLQNAFVGGYVKPLKDLNVGVEYHYYAMSTTLPDMDKTLGHDFELKANYRFMKDVTISAGISYMIGTETMERLKRATDEGSLGWGWLSLNITPKIFTTKW